MFYAVLPRYILIPISFFFLPHQCECAVRHTAVLCRPNHIWTKHSVYRHFFSIVSPPQMDDRPVIIDKVLLLYFHNAMRKKKEELELSKYYNELSNLENKISDVLLMCCHLGTMWKQADLLTAQKLQNLLFPDGIYWDKEIDPVIEP